MKRSRGSSCTEAWWPRSLKRVHIFREIVSCLVCVCTKSRSEKEGRTEGKEIASYVALKRLEPYSHSKQKVIDGASKIMIKLDPTT